MARGVPISLDANHAQKKSKPKNYNLPFGLKAPRKKRRAANTNRKPSAVKRNKTESSDFFVEGMTEGMKSNLLAVDSDEDIQESGLSGIDAYDDPDSGSDSSATSSSSSSSDFDSEGEELPVNPQQREEVNSIRQMLRSVEEEKEVEKVVPDQKLTTQCNPFIGITAIGQQVAARLATCRFCSQKISKGSVRVAYAYSKVKFHCWLHTACFAPYLEKEKGDYVQAKTFLENWIQDKRDAPLEMQNEIKILLSKLKSSGE